VVASIKNQEDLDVLTNNMLEAYVELLVLYAGPYLCSYECNFFCYSYYFSLPFVGAAINLVCLSSVTGFVFPT
jgi:hypothetical protein